MKQTSREKRQTSNVEKLSLRQSEGAVVLKVWVQPRASNNEVAGLFGDSLKVKVVSPPVENRANETLCEFLSQLAGVKRRQVEIISGQKTRLKEVRIRACSCSELRRKLNQLI